MDIAHAQYPCLHRIRALRNIGSEVKSGDLGGFVESEGNLSYEPDDDAWLFDDAIACGDAYVDGGSCMHDKSIACNRAYVSQKSILSGSARVEDDAYVRGAILTDQARVSGFSQVLCSGDTLYSPMLSGRCAVYGDVYGNTQLTGSALVIRGEEVRNDTPDTLVIDGERR